jgi:hypothetical protein
LVSAIFATVVAATPTLLSTAFVAPTATLLTVTITVAALRSLRQLKEWRKAATALWYSAGVLLVSNRPSGGYGPLQRGFNFPLDIARRGLRVRLLKGSARARNHRLLHQHLLLEHRLAVHHLLLE